MTRKSLWRNPGLVLSLVLLALWVASWILFLGLMPGAKRAGLPLIAWSQLLISALGVLFSLIAIPMFDRWERR